MCQIRDRYGYKIKKSVPVYWNNYNFAKLKNLHEYKKKPPIVMISGFGEWSTASAFMSFCMAS